MNLSHKIEKLLATKDEENIKLAKNIVIAKVNQSNVIAFICVLKNTSNYNILKESDITREIASVISEKVKVIDNISDVNFEMPLLYRWALQSFKSVENLKVSTKSYIDYVNNLTQIEMANLVNKEEPQTVENDEIPF